MLTATVLGLSRKNSYVHGLKDTSIALLEPLENRPYSYSQPAITCHSLPLERSRREINSAKEFIFLRHNSFIDRLLQLEFSVPRVTFGKNLSRCKYKI